MPSEKPVGSAAPKGFLSAQHNFRLSAANIGYESIGLEMRRQSLNEIDDRADGCGQHNQIASLASSYWIGNSVVDRFNFLRVAQDVGLIAADDLSLKSFLFKAPAQGIRR